MSESPSPLDSKTVSRMVAAGAVLGIVGIILFLGMWVLLGNLGVDVAVRLFASLCLPPAVITAIILGYMLLSNSKHPT